MVTKTTYYILVLGLFLGFIVSSCNKTELEEQKTALIIKVKDDQGNDVLKNDVQVYLFDDYNVYSLAASNEDPSLAISNALLKGGQCTFEDLDSDKSYWVYINYVNDSGAKINNFYSQYSLKNLLEDGAITTVSINLEPYDTGNIAFYSTELSNQDDLSIDVFINRKDGGAPNLIGVITGLASGEPESVNDPNVLNFLYQEPGDYSYYAIGNNGCVWQGTFTVEVGNGDFTKVNLTACEFGYIDLWVNDASFSIYGDVSVVFNDIDDVGTITSSRSSVPSNCETEGVLQVARPPGNYVVHATSQSGCVWVKVVEVKAGCQNSPVEFTGVCN